MSRCQPGAVLVERLDKRTGRTYFYLGEWTDEFLVINDWIFVAKLKD